jgi:hypothetical protein
MEDLEDDGWLGDEPDDITVGNLDDGAFEDAGCRVCVGRSEDEEQENEETGKARSRSIHRNDSYKIILR